MHVNVYDNDCEQALKALKKKMQRNGITYDMKRARLYEKPCVKKRRQKAECDRVKTAGTDQGMAISTDDSASTENHRVDFTLSV